MDGIYDDFYHTQTWGAVNLRYQSEQTTYYSQIEPDQVTTCESYFTQLSFVGLLLFPILAGPFVQKHDEMIELN